MAGLEQNVSLLLANRFVTCPDVCGFRCGTQDIQLFFRLNRLFTWPSNGLGSAMLHKDACVPSSILSSYPTRWTSSHVLFSGSHDLNVTAPCSTTPVSCTLLDWYSVRVLGLLEMKTNSSWDGFACPVQLMMATVS
jgi:hypothetical protein